MKITRAAAILTVTVPRLDSTAMPSTQPLATPRAQGLSADSFGAGIGQAIQKVSGEAMQLASKELAEQDASRVNKAQADYESAKVKFLHDPEQGLLNTLGESAITPVDGKTLDQRAQDWRKNYVAESVAGLGNQRQKDLFTKYADKDAPTIDNSVMAHVVKQGQVVKLGNAKAATDTQADTAIALGSNSTAVLPGEFERHIEGLKEKVAVESLLHGFGPDSDYAKNLLSDKMSKVYATVIKNRIAQDDDAGAIAFFNANKDQLKSEMTTIEPIITKLEVMKEGKDTAGAIWEQFKPKDINSALDIEGMRKKLSESGAKDQIKAFAEKRIEELSGEYRRQKQLNEEGASNRIYGMVVNEKAGYTQVAKAIETDENIDNRTKDALLTWADHKFRISEGRAEAKSAAKQELQLKQLTKLLSFQQEYLRGDYGTLTPAQLSKKTAELGQFTDDAMKFVQNVNGDLNKAKVTDSELMDTVRVLSQNENFKKLLPNVDKPNGQDKAKMALLQGKVQEYMAQSKDSPGKGMAVKEATLKAIQGLKTDSGYFSDTVDPLYTVGTDFSSKYGKNPAKWPKDTQNKYISEVFYSNPRNKGKRLDFKTIERYRSELVKGL